VEIMIFANFFTSSLQSHPSVLDYLMILVSLFVLVKCTPYYLQVGDLCLFRGIDRSRCKAQVF